MGPNTTSHFAEGTRWLPDFCNPVRLFVVFLVAEMLVLIYALSALGRQSDLLTSFSVTSLFAQLIALNLVLILCKARGLLNRLPVVFGVLVYALLLATTAWFYACLALWLNQNLQTPFGPAPSDQQAFVLRTVIMTCLAGLVLLRYFYVQRQWQKKTRQHAEARFMALQSRIKPHFLFNSMNSIASLIAIDPQQAEKAVENLAGLFRYALRENTAYTVPLKQELDWANKYLAMEKVRLGDRLQCETHIAPELAQAHIPALSLQPLMENAVVHGIQARPEGGKINLEAHTEGNQLVIQIRNPLPKHRPVSEGHGMALANIRERLALLYGDKASLQSGTAGDEFHVTMRLPLQP